MALELLDYSRMIDFGRAGLIGTAIGIILIYFVYKQVTGTPKGWFKFFVWNWVMGFVVLLGASIVFPIFEFNMILSYFFAGALAFFLPAYFAGRILGLHKKKTKWLMFTKNQALAIATAWTGISFVIPFVLAYI